jgi:large subunit ribosomal protein L25
MLSARCDQESLGEELTDLRVTLLPKPFSPTRIMAEAPMQRVENRLKELEKALSTEYGSRVLLKLSISGYDKKKRIAMVKDIQIDPVTYRWVHADLYAIDLKREVEVEVPVKLVGASPGVKMGGILEQIRRELTIKALPNNIPSVIEIDISSLGIGDSIHVDDIAPENYTIEADSNFTILTVSSPEAEAEEEEVEEEEMVEEQKEAEEEKE